MHTVASARAWAIYEFKKAQVESPALTADLLLGFVLGWDRVRVLSHAEQSVPQEAWVRLQGLVFRRLEGEPLQYLTGEKEFYGLVFRVTPDVLIPRPETETLVEKAIQIIRSRSLARTRFVDIGTGSGCIAISVAHEIPNSIGWAVDISAAALRIAHENAVRNQVAERILLVQADLLECFPRKSCFDFVLCNPPYVPLEEYDSLTTEVRDHEPHYALFGGDSGLEIYRRLMPEVSSRIVSGGFLLFELGAGQAECVVPLVEREGFSVEMIENDLQGIPRCLIGRRLHRSTATNG
jgi:release factor glutamine methyltransferase